MENKLEQQVLSEVVLMDILGLTKKQLDHLRWGKGLPYVSLQRKARVYIADDVLEFIERQARQELYDREFKAALREKKRGEASTGQ